MCDLTGLNESRIPPVNGSANLSAKTQYKKGKSSSPAGKKNKSAESLKDVVMEAAAAAVKTTSPGGHEKKMTQAEAMLWLLFSKATKGDLGAINAILKLALEYMPPTAEQTPSQKDHDSGWTSIELDQECLDALKEGGYLPAACPEKIADVDEKVLQKAIWLSRKNRN
jgi:hypothetical protein